MKYFPPFIIFPAHCEKSGDSNRKSGDFFKNQKISCKIRSTGNTADVVLGARWETVRPCVCIQSSIAIRYSSRPVLSTVYRICEDWTARTLYCLRDRNSMLIAANALIDFKHFQVLVTHRHKPL